MEAWIGFIGAILGATIASGASLIALTRSLRAQQEQHHEALASQNQQHRDTVELEIEHRRADRLIDRRNTISAARAEIATTLNTVQAFTLPRDTSPIPSIGLDATLEAAHLLMTDEATQNKLVMTYLQTCRLWNSHAQVLNTTITEAGSSAVATRTTLIRELQTQLRDNLTDAAQWS